MPAPCGKCPAPSVILVRYSGEHLCREHFCRFVEKRVKRDVRRQGPFPRGAHVVVALSGGKDSVVTLRLLHAIFHENPHVRLSALAVDEGISGYRPPALDVAEAHCKSLGVPLRVRSYAEDAGLTMDDVMAANPGHAACGTCGPLRRRGLNRGAREAGATHLATGHNLDDTAQSILMNVLKGDTDRLARLGPHTTTKDGLVPRILPLRSIPEKEVALYAILKGWRFHDDECPYSSDATRGKYRDVLLALEAEDPGTRHAIVSGYDRIAPALKAAAPDARMDACERCGEPTGGARVCAACRRVAEVRRPNVRVGSG